jgi:hypothetical protein
MWISKSMDAQVPYTKWYSGLEVWLSDTVPAYQVQNPDFKPQYRQIKKGRNGVVFA